MKRALYLAHLAIILRKSDLIEQLSYSHHHGNRLKPVLLLKPAGVFHCIYIVIFISYCASITKQYNLVPAKGVISLFEKVTVASLAGKVTGISSMPNTCNRVWDYFTGGDMCSTLDDNTAVFFFVLGAVSVFN